MPAISENQVRLVLAAIAAVCSFLLVQSDVVVPDLLKVVLGAVIVALAVINPTTVVNKVTGVGNG